jgi:hypothetical protein
LTTTLSVLDRSGDIKIEWDHADPARREWARAEVERLRAAGYTFYLVDGTPADEVAAGGGTLVVRRLDAAEVVDPPADEPAPAPAPDDAPAATAPKRRGRPPKAQAADRQVVAARPLAGG